MQHVFLMCSERSGSNLITRLMDAHPAICGPAPSHLIRILAQNAVRYGDPTDDQQWERLLKDASAILETKLGDWVTDWDTNRLRREVRTRSLGSLVRTVVESEAKANGAGTVFIKENHLADYLPFVQHAFHGTKIVAMVRDPRDMALSWKNSPVLRGDVVRATRIWQNDQRQLLEVLGQLRIDRDIMLITYEDLVSDTAGVLADTCSFLGLDPDPAMLSFHDHAATAQMAQKSDTWKNLRQPVMTNNFNKWREGLDADEITYVEHVCGDTMRAFGYEPEMPPHADPAALEHQLTAHERHEKPAYADVPQPELVMRRRREEVVARIASHPLVPRHGFGTDEPHRALA